MVPYRHPDRPVSRPRHIARSPWLAATSSVAVMSSPEPLPPRSLTQMLREWDDAALVRLLTARPDLASPPPETLSQLASRATTRESVREALDSLSAYDLWVAACLVATDPEEGDAEEPVDLHTPDIEAAVARLHAMALLWGAADDLRPVRALAAELPTAGWMAADEPPWARPPDLDGATTVDPDRVDAAAAGSAFELVRRIAVLLEHLSVNPPSGRRDGELSLLEARRLSDALGVSVPLARTDIAVAEATGLLGRLGGTTTGPLRTTPAVDAWSELDLPDQWALVAKSWWLHHQPSGSPSLKAVVLAAYGEPGSGTALTAPDLLRWMDWRLPRRATETARVLPHLIDSATAIGVMALGALPRFAHGDRIETLAAMLPTRDETVLVQNDLTAVAPGPLTRQAAHELGALADIESRGGATVYRFTPDSLGRAYALGWSRRQIEATLETRSRTPIPQALAYLVADLDRTRGLASEARHHGARTGQHFGSVRLGTPSPRSGPVGSAPDAAGLLEVVWAIRRAEAAFPAHGSEAAERTEVRDPDASRMGETALETLRQAVETGEHVWIGFVRPGGEPAERVVIARSVDDGRLHASDATSGATVSVPVHRISAAHIIRRQVAPADS